MWRSVRIREDRYDEVAALARGEGRSVASMVDRLLVRGVAVPGGRDPEPSLASGVGAAVSAGLAVSSAPVASDGALAEPGESLSEGGIATRSGGLCSPVGEAVGHGLPGSANALTFVPPSLKQSVTTAGDLAKKQVTPHLKSEQAKGGKR